MKALVTGCEGFVGRHYVTFLKDLMWEVYGMDTASDPEDCARKYFAEDTEDHYDLVVHCAYEVGGRSHIDGVNMALAHNVSMDALMFDWAIKGGADAVLYFSSSAAYPVELQTKDNHRALSEGDINQFYDLKAPDTDYGWAKLTGERIAQAASNNGLRVHIVRPFSGYGSDQTLQYPFPSIVKRASEGDFTVWGPRGQTRDWIHISDVVDASYTVFENDERRPVNLCTGIPTDMEELVMTINEAVTGDGACEVTYLEDKPTGVFYRVGDPTRMNEHYTAKVSLEEGVLEALGKNG